MVILLIKKFKKKNKNNNLHVFILEYELFDNFLTITSFHGKFVTKNCCHDHQVSMESTIGARNHLQNRASSNRQLKPYTCQIDQKDDILRKSPSFRRHLHLPWSRAVRCMVVMLSFVGWNHLKIWIGECGRTYNVYESDECQFWDSKSEFTWMKCSTIAKSFDIVFYYN